MTVAVVVATGGAGAQTTTSSSTSTTATVVSTTSTTFVNPCTGQPCIPAAPAATLSGSGGELQLQLDSSCWRAPVFAADGPRTTCMASARSLDDRPPGLVVRAGETLTLRFAIGMAPTAVVLRRGDEPATRVETALSPTNPTLFVASLPVGVHVVTIGTRWNQGHVDYRVTLDVRAAARPATPTRGRIALTG